MLASPAGSKVVMPGFEGLAHFVPIAAIVIQTVTPSIGQVRTVSGCSLQCDRRVTHRKLEGYRFPSSNAQSIWRSE
jgi:hypothetical protein